jgi:hypothetical protein
MVFLVHYLENNGYVAKLGVLSPLNHAISFVALAILFTVSGLQMRLALEKSEGVALSLLDTFALPVTQSFWGHVIPIQGSFIYGATFLKAKYGANVSGTMAVYLFITFCSLMIGALFGIVYSLLTHLTYIAVFIFLALLPIWILIADKLLAMMRPRSGLMARIRGFTALVLQTVLTLFSDPLFVFKVVAIDLAYVLLFSLWSLHLSGSLGLDIPFPIWVLVSFFIKLTIIAKFTPGNMGVIQLFTGGVLAAYGHPLEAGILISTLQLGLLVVMSFPIAIILTIVQFKYVRRLFFRS